MGALATSCRNLCNTQLSDTDFGRIRRLLHERTGIALGPEKKALVASRLDKRLRALALGSLGHYFDLIERVDQPAELQTAIDLLTTNETYFFREPAHFRFLRDWVAAQDAPGRRWRAWSAASSSGQEAYSIAMTFADVVGPARWEVLGTDISTRVLARAATGHFTTERLEHFPADLLRRYCLKGVGPQEGTFLVNREIRAQVAFRQVNLLEPLQALGHFDVIFLRNVLIYFDVQTKRDVVGRVTAQLVPQGHFVVSHSESLHGINHGLAVVAPGIYRRG